MTDSFQSRHQLLEEVNKLKQRIIELESTQGLAQAVKQAELKYRILFENASDSILIINPRTLEILDANANAARRLKYTPQEIVRLKITDVEIMPDDDTKQFSWVSTFSGARVYECVHRCKDGSKVPVEVSSRLIHIDNRDVLQNFVRDLTRRKQAEKQERELLIERERVQLLSNFMTGASHQFKTPLSVIASRSYLLGRTDDPEHRKAHGEMIAREVKSMAALIDSSVMLSTLASTRHLDFAPVDLIEVAREVIDSKESNLQEKQITIHTQYAQPAIQIPGHADYLFHTLSHLLDNAIQYSHPHGDIWLRTGYSDDTAVIEIEDAGTGISGDDLPRIFETFFRGDKSGTTRGFGLGLPIAKMIVELHHGSLTVETQSGRGSLFRVLLPVHQPA